MAVVILNQKDYIAMCEKFILEEKGFCAVTHSRKEVIIEITHKIKKARVIGFLQTAVKKEWLENNQIFPSFKGMPKIHKEKEGSLFKVRLIINCKHTAIMVISKIIDTQIKSLDYRSKFSINNWDPLLAYLRKNEIIPNTRMVSLDVANLYTSLTPNHIRQAVYFAYECNSQLTKEGSLLNIKGLIQLIELLFQIQFFEFNNRYFLQSSGMFMGLPSSAAIAQLVMNFIEYQITSIDIVFLKYSSCVVTSTINS